MSKESSRFDPDMKRKAKNPNSLSVTDMKLDRKPFTSKGKGKSTTKMTLKDEVDK